MKVTISRLGHPKNCILNGGRQTIFPAFLSQNTIRLIRTFEELSFNRLKHQDTFHERLIKVRHLGFKFEQRTGATIWRTLSSVHSLVHSIPKLVSSPLVTHAWLLVGCVTACDWSCHVSCCCCFFRKNLRSLLSSGNAPPINVRFLLFRAGLHGIRKDATKERGFRRRKHLNHGLGAKLKYI